MTASRIRTVALLAGEPGLSLLREVLLGRSDLEIAAVFTPLRRPEGEGLGRRAEVDAFRAVCREAGVALVFADGPEACDLEPLLPFGELDLLVRLAWAHPLDARTLGKWVAIFIGMIRRTLAP